MAQLSSIEWTESTWNPVTGCSKLSPGCANCYAERMAKRLQAMSSPNYKNGFKVTTHEHLLELPLMWKKPQTIFVNSMSDLFHESIPDSFIFKTFEVMKKANWHRFQILTKRSNRLIKLNSHLVWQPNILMGVSVENADYQYRIDNLKETNALTKFISFEPLIGPVEIHNLKGIDWVIVGGESGPKARPINQEWVTGIRDECFGCEIPFFFKQWGGWNKKKNGRLLEGRTWDDMPQFRLSPAF